MQACILVWPLAVTMHGARGPKPTRTMHLWYIYFAATVALPRPGGSGNESDGLVEHDGVRLAHHFLEPRGRENLQDAVAPRDVGAPVALGGQPVGPHLQEGREGGAPLKAQGPRLAVHLVVVRDGPRLVVQRVLDLQGKVVAALLKGPPHAKAELGVVLEERIGPSGALALAVHGVGAGWRRLGGARRL